jgi:rhamnulokinase
MRPTKKTRNVVAIDLTSESGRLVLCRWDGNEGTLSEAHRFPISAHEEAGHWLWNTESIWQEICKGLRLAATHAHGAVGSAGVDGWPGDYVLMDRTGRTLGRCYCYRDARSLPQMERVFSLVSRGRMLDITGVQCLCSHTLFQLLAHVAEFPGEWERTASWLTLPEYFHYRLTGIAAAESTQAATTQMLDQHTKSWSKEITTAAGLSLSKFPTLARPGTCLGKIQRDLAQDLRLVGAQVIAPACHDISSAVAGIPSAVDQLAYVIPGAASLVGTMLRKPWITAESSADNFSNICGVGGEVLFHKQVIGLSVLEECLREWKAQGKEFTAVELAGQCTSAPANGATFDVNGTDYLEPGNMVARINSGIRALGFSREERPAEVAAIIYRSLARRYGRILKEIHSMTGKSFRRVAILESGGKNEVFHRLIGELTGLEVVPGINEPAAAGNAAVQIAALENAASLNDIHAISSKLHWETSASPPQA